MNEQLIVKNFGPITDATVDFKRVTVFIGPTGGGKSTLAKLAATMRSFKFLKVINTNQILFDIFRVKSFIDDTTFLSWYHKDKFISFANKSFAINEVFADEFDKKLIQVHKEMSEEMGFPALDELYKVPTDTNAKKTFGEVANVMLRGMLEKEVYNALSKKLFSSKVQYFPAERIFVPMIEYSWAGLMRDDIGLPKPILDFANTFSLARKEVCELEIPFLDAKFLHIDGRDFIKIPGRQDPIMLLEAASGIQSVTPLMVLAERFNRDTWYPQSFIIEEPELNLYPTAQQGLLNWLVEKCTKGENDLIITTHSPYILSSCNLLLEAYKVAQQRPDLEDEIAAIVPKACWLNPDEFTAYYVADGTVKPITDERTHLIGGNELDAVSGDISDSFRKLLRLQKQKPQSA